MQQLRISFIAPVCDELDVRVSRSEIGVPKRTDATINGVLHQLPEATTILEALNRIGIQLLTGNIGKPGSGINPLRGQNNVQGAAVMGCEPAGLTGGVSLEQGRARFENVWGAPIPSSRGSDLLQMIDAAASGDLKAMYVIGYDILMTLAKTTDVRRALARLDCVIVQDFVMNETAREFGTVFFPAATAFEKDGTFMNSERRIQRVRKAVDAPGMARSDSWIVAELASRLGVMAASCCRLESTPA